MEKSHTIEVKDGDTVEITTSKWSYVSQVLVFLFVMLMVLAPTRMLQTIILIIAILMALSTHFVEAFHVTKKF